MLDPFVCGLNNLPKHMLLAFKSMTSTQGSPLSVYLKQSNKPENNNNNKKPI